MSHPASRHVTLWFNPRCGSCLRALELLRERGIEPELRRYLEEAPTVGEVEELLGKLKLPPQAVARPSEDEYQALRLSERTPREEMVRALAQHPRILQRPILVAGNRAVVGRPPERILEILEERAPVDG
ncbi:MAG TPA: arsenate reductase (glutaredoxin) [Anaeromyxobacteraceae bacterium]